MLKVASPYLKQGRPADYQHTKFLLNLAPGIVRKEKLDESIIIPALIFHELPAHFVLTLTFLLRSFYTPPLKYLQV